MDTAIHPEDAHVLLKRHGLRATPQRIAMAELLFSSAQHVTPLSVYQSLCDQFPSLSQNTVYLTLAQFEQKGLLRRLPIPGGMLFDSRTGPHDHACCRLCGEVMDVPAAARSSRPPVELSTWSIEQEGRVWSGVCPRCAAEKTCRS